MSRESVTALTIVLVVGLLDVWVVRDAREQRNQHVSTEGAVVRAIADLALSSTARWLRNPSNVEPWAAVADHPASLDTEPAGAVIGPPFGR